MNLKRRIAVVTGAGGGIGSEIVRLLKKEGVRTVLVEKEKSLLEGIMDILDGDESYIYECDFSKPAEVGRLSKELSEKFPKVDLLFNVAGIGIYKNLEDLSIEEWQKSIDINLIAPLIMTKGLLSSLENSEEAVVVNIGSGKGVIPAAGQVAYSSTKFGLRGMSLSLSREFEGKNIDFVLMTLGSVMTNFGTGGMAQRKKFEEAGKKYLDPKVVARKMIDIVKSESREAEYKIYPEGYESSN